MDCSPGLYRPYTFVVMSILIVILGVVAIERTPTDIFPNIDIPVIGINWDYTGLSPQDMSDRIDLRTSSEASRQSVNDIEHIESQSLTGIAIVKVFFQPNANVTAAIAEITAVAQKSAAADPSGNDAAFHVFLQRFDRADFAGGVSSGQGLSEQQLFDTATNFIRPQLVTVHGAVLPNAYGGKQRQIEVDLNTSELQAKGLSANDVVNAISSQNLILPAGTAKIGPFEYQVDLNESPQKVSELNDLPIRTVNGSTIYIRDVANVRDGYPPQTNIVRVDGSRSVLMSVIENREHLDARYHLDCQGQASEDPGRRSATSSRPLFWPTSPFSCAHRSTA